MRQVQPARERLFVDFAGQTVVVVAPATGEIRAAQIFVAVLGASNLTYAEAAWTQTLPDWIGAHVRALEFIGGVPRQIVPDNLRSGVLRANWYEPGLNPTYTDLAGHYGTAILPARVRRPRDEAKVEAGVLVVQRWILARLRHRRFTTLAVLNAAIAKLLESLNNRPMRCLGGSWRQLFEQWNGRRCATCHPSPTSTPSGGSGAPGSPTISMSKATTTQCRTGCCASRGGAGLRGVSLPWGTQVSPVLPLGCCVGLAERSGRGKGGGTLARGGCAAKIDDDRQRAAAAIGCAGRARHPCHANEAQDR